MDALCFDQLLCHGCGYRGNIRSPQVPDSHLSEQGSGRRRAQARMEIGQRQVLFQLVAADHVSDHGVLTDGDLRRLLVRDLTT